VRRAHVHACVGACACATLLTVLRPLVTLSATPPTQQCAQCLRCPTLAWLAHPCIRSTLISPFPAAPQLRRCPRTTATPSC
jgi:hypothetical protein